jgi:hypothetical protein
VHISPNEPVDEVKGKLQSLLKYKNKDKDTVRRKKHVGLIQIVLDKITAKFDANGSRVPYEGLTVHAYIQNNGKYVYQMEYPDDTPTKSTVYMGNHFVPIE